MISENHQRKNNRPSLLYSIVRGVVRVLGPVLFGVKIIKGKNSLPDDGGCILAGNHISLVDPVLVTAGQKRQICYMAKGELFRNPIIRVLGKWYGAFPIDRGSADMGSINRAMEIIENGNVLGIFPEGTRSKSGKLGTGKSGTIMIAYHANAPIYPFAVYTRKGVHLFCKYTIAFGEPVTVQQLGVVEGKTSEYREATRALMKIISDLRDECIESR